MQARANAAREEQQPAQQQAFEYSQQPAVRSGINPGTRTTLQAEPAFRGVFSFGTPDG